MMSSEVTRMWRVTGAQSHKPMSSCTPRAPDVGALETVALGEDSQASASACLAGVVALAAVNTAE
eukprot:734070-Pyramimonas_sp.AAC.1